MPVIQQQIGSRHLAIAKWNGTCANKQIRIPISVKIKRYNRAGVNKNAVKAGKVFFEITLSIVQENPWPELFIMPIKFIAAVCNDQIGEAITVYIYHTGGNKFKIGISFYIRLCGFYELTTLLLHEHDALAHPGRSDKHIIE